MIRRLGAALLLALVTNCKPDQPKPPVETKPASVTLTVFSSGDIGSDTDVCGCKVRQMGGVARRAKVIRDEMANGGPTVVIDAGDLFFRNWNVSPRYEPQARETAKFHADFLRHFDVPAIAVGERDLALGIGTLRSLAERANVTLLSANLRHTDSGTAAFDAFTVVSRGGVKIGLVGASPVLPEEAQANLVYKRAGLQAEPPLAHVEAAAGSARKAGAQIVIALLHVRLERARQILDTLPAGTIDFAVVAHDRLTQNLQLSRESRSAFMMVGDRGKWLGVTEIEVVRGAKGVVNIGAVRAQADQIKKLDERIAEYKASKEDPDPKVRADRAATLGRLEARKKAMADDLTKVDAEGHHRLDGKLVPLDRELEEDPKVLAMYQTYQAALHRVNAGGEPTARGDLTYVGNASCKSCHEAAFKQWTQTGHAKAWATMQKTRQTANLDCVPCHVTGFDRPGGPRRIQDLSSYVNVGCESCHGQGSAHAKTPKVALDYMRDVPEKVCAECHRAQEDQKPFVFEDRLPKVLGAGHGRPTGYKTPKRSP